MYRLSLNLQTAGILKTPRIIKAFERIDRRLFVLENYHYASIDDRPLPIGTHATISAPHMHVLVTEHLERYLQPGNTVLDVGSGSGYLSCLFSDLVEDSLVIGIDIDENLVKLSIKNSCKLERMKAKIVSGNLVYMQSDAKTIRFDPDEMFDAIHVGAMARQIPINLVSGLKIGGCLIIPVDGKLKKIIRISYGQYTETDLEDVNYVELR